MPDQSRYSRVVKLARRSVEAFWVSDQTSGRGDSDGLRYVATFAVRVHWFILPVLIFELLYQPYYLYVGVGRFIPLPLLLLVLVGFNGYLHYRLLKARPVAWRMLVALCVLDVVLVSATLALSEGFNHSFVHLFYYPALAGLAALFTSFRATMAWVTMASVIYLTISLTVGDGINTEARDEKALLARIAIMYLVVAAVNLATSFERARWMRRERALQRERVDLSRAIHDTAAQTAYMIGLGIDTASAQVRQASPEASATLQAASRLSRSLIWELRQPINMGGIFEGVALNRALRSHADSFTNVTLVPTEVTHRGVEPPLTMEAKSLLFSIAHNALTNAYRHAEASNVGILLEFAEDHSRLSVSDDGIGLPDDYEERGKGFVNMNRAAEQLGGRLVVKKRGDMGGATVTCLIPHAIVQEEHRDVKG